MSNLFNNQNSNPLTNSFSAMGQGNYGNSAVFGANGSQSFMESNSLVSNFSFLLLIIFVFIILLRIGVSLIMFFMQPTDSPHLIDGMIDAKQMQIFHQDPSNNGAVTIYRSVNANDGIEFTWSVWLFINSIENTYDEFKHVFSKGNNNIGENGIMDPNNAPGLYIAPNSNTLIVTMNTFRVINEEITIPNIPVNKWVNVIIRCQNTTFDVYVNGTISRSINLIGVPKQNYGDVIVAANGGFDGYISNLWYYNYALGTSAIQKLVEKGPNTKMIGTSGISDTLYDYLSMRWYFFGAGNGFNPDLPSAAMVTKTTTTTTA